MSICLKKICLFFVLVLLVGCSSAPEKKVKRLVSPVPIFTPPTRVIVQKEEVVELPKDRVVDSYWHKMYNNPKPLYQRLEKNIQVVEVERTVIKPVVNVGSFSKNLTRDEVEGVLDDLWEEEDLEDGVEYENANVKNLIENYKNILQVSATCCVSNITDKFNSLSLPKTLLLSFLATDAEDYAMQNMCLILSDEDIADVVNVEVVAGIVKDAKRDCICNNVEFLKDNIINFYRMYDVDPEFYNEILVYRFKDIQGRVVEQDINEAVFNVSTILNTCP